MTYRRPVHVDVQSMYRPRYHTGQGRPVSGRFTFPGRSEAKLSRPAAPELVQLLRQCDGRAWPGDAAGRTRAEARCLGTLPLAPWTHPLDVHGRNLRHQGSGFVAHPGPAQQAVCRPKVLTPDGAVRCGLGPLVAMDECTVY